MFNWLLKVPVLPDPEQFDEEFDQEAHVVNWILDIPLIFEAEHDVWAMLFSNTYQSLVITE